MVKAKILTALNRRELNEKGTWEDVKDVHYTTDDGRIGFITILAGEYNKKEVEKRIKKDLEEGEALSKEFEV